MMSNGVRHGLGFLAGLLLPPLAALALMYGVSHLSLTLAQRFELSFPGLGLVVLAGAGLAFLAGSRISPVASLMGGLLYVLLGVVPFLTMYGIEFRPEQLLPGLLRNGYTGLALQGILLMLGVMLLVASAFPSRWRGRARADAAPAYPGYPPPAYPGPADQAPYQDPFQARPYPPEPSYGAESRPEDTTRPMHRE